MLDAHVVVRRVAGRLRADQPSLQRDLTHLRSAARSLVASAISFVVSPVAGAATELLGDIPRQLPQLPTRRRAIRMQARPLHEAPESPTTLAFRFVAHVGGGSLRRHERLVPAGVVLVLLLAGTVSALPVVGPQTAAAGVQSTHRPRLVIEGLTENGMAYMPQAAPSGGEYVDTTIENVAVGHEAGTNTQLTRTYTVQPGDTAGTIAEHFGISLNTLYWANKTQLKDPQSIWPGQDLVIPPTDGLIVTVGENDTLESLAKKYGTTVSAIVDANDLYDPVIVAKQSLMIPGAQGDPLPTPTPAPVVVAPKVVSGGGGGGGGGSAGSIPSYSGRLLWPVFGGYISQYFSYYHPALDIAAPYGTGVRAAAGGTVVYAGWRSYSGGGNVIWIAVPGGLYITYNHLSAWYVSVGETVAAGQKIGAIGTSGVATGPHLHFEVWTVYPWSRGTTAGIQNPCAYLGC